MSITERPVRVWDPVVRVGHWLVVAGFAVAYLTEDDLLGLHVWAGYLVGAIVLLRIVWGFLGTRYARFSDFLYRPAAMATYLLDLIRFRARRYLGHSPAGAAMVFALLVSLSGTVITGMALYGAEEKAGPLAPLFAHGAPAPSPPRAVSTARAGEKSEGSEARKAGRKSGKDVSEGLEELHEFFAALTLWLVAAHIAGVLWASFAHRENLAKAMITGVKRAPGDADAIGPNIDRLGVALKRR
jgi:cytochrome b